MLCFLLLLFLPGMGNSATNEKVTIQLKWLHQFQFAGYYAALEKGFYTDEGLDVELRQRDLTTSHIDDVLQGLAQYGTADAGLVMPRLQGKPVVLLAQIFQHSPLVFLTLKDSGIETPQDMAGKRVSFDIQWHSSAPLIALLLKAFKNINAIKLIENRGIPHDLIDGTIDVHVAYVTVQPYWFYEKNTAVNIINPRDYGIDFYGDNLFTTEAELHEHPERVEKLRRATLKGWRYALNNREEMIELILQKYNPQGVSRGHLAYEARETEKLILPDLIEMGTFDSSRYQTIANTYVKSGFIEKANLDSDFFYKTKTEQGKIHLNEQEQTYLDSTRFQRVLTQRWMPFSMKNEEGKTVGLGQDYWALICNKLGLNAVTNELESSFATGIKLMQQGKADIITDTTSTGERETYAIFSDSYMDFPIAVANQTGVGPIFSAAALEGKLVAVGRNYRAYHMLKSRYPEIKFLQVANTTEALKQVADGNAVAAVDILPVLQYHIDFFKAGIVKLAGVTDVRFPVQVMVRKEHAQLVALINRAIAAITPLEHTAIQQKWMMREVISAPDYTLLWQVLSMMALILGIILYWNRRLAKEIAERKRVEEQLQQANIVVEESPVVLFRWKAIENWPAEYVSSNVIQFGYTSNSFMSGETSYSSIVHPEDLERVNRKVQENSNAGVEQFSQEYRIVSPTGEIFWIDDRTLVGRDADRNISYYQGVIIDITERKQAEKEKENLQNELLHSQKMESLGHLAGGIAHEFNNLLGIINGYAELSVTKCINKGDEKLLEYISSIATAGKRAANLVSEMLSFTRSKQIDDAPQNISSLVVEDIKMLRSTLPSTIEIETKIDQQLPNVLMNQTQLNQILMNLCINARDAMDGVGKLTVELHMQHGLDAIDSVSHKPIQGDWIELSISDTGSGINPETARNIFTPFFTTKEVGKGTGMGLPIIYRIMEDHAGHILFDSEPGKGTTFRLLFHPIASEATSARDDLTEKPAEIPKGDGSEVLVVDDEGMLARHMSEVINNCGYKSYYVIDSTEALNLFKENPDRFSILITDQTMPKITGKELIDKLRAIRPELPAILCSGYSDKIDSKEVSELNISYFSKPVDVSRIMREISKLLALKN